MKDLEKEPNYTPRGNYYTKKQYQLAKVWVENELHNSGLPMSEMLLRSGYAATTADQYGRRQITKPGTQYAIREIKKGMHEALMEKGVVPEYLADKVHEMLEGRFAKEVNFRAVNFGLEHAFKLGIGGGYAPEKSIVANVNVTPEELKKFAPLKEEFEERLREQELNDAPTTPPEV